MRVVLADNPADMLQLRLAVIGPKLPDNLAALFIDNGDNIRFAGIPDNIVRMETLIARVVPFVRPQRRHGVDMHPVAHAAAAGAHVRIVIQRRTRRVVKPQLLKMVAAAPFPYHVALPVDLNNGVVQQQLVGNGLVHQVGVGQNQRIAPFHLRLQPRRIVAYRVTRSLIIMVRARHPAGFIARIAHLLVAVEFPGNVTFPVHLNQVEHILHAVARVALAAVAKNRAAGQDFIGKPVQFRPFTHHVAVHIHQHRTVFGGLEKGVTAPRPLWIVEGGAGWVDGRMSHIFAP